MRNYRDLQVWNKAHALTLSLYQLSRTFPKEETYGLTSQLHRAAGFLWEQIWPRDVAAEQAGNSPASFVRHGIRE